MRLKPFIPSPRTISAVNRRLAGLPDGLRAHIERARAEGIQIAVAFEVDPPAVDFALAAHDLFRAEPPEALLTEAERLGWKIDDVERSEPMLLHGPVAGLWLRLEAGLDYPELVDAVTYHTTFAPRLGPLAAAVFVADKVEPEKLGRSPWLAEVRQAALQRMVFRSVAMYLDRLSTDLLARGDTPHPRALEAIDWIRDRHASRRPPG